MMLTELPIDDMFFFIPVKLHNEGFIYLCRH